MGLESRLCEITEYNEEGYSPVIDYGKWRVAILNYIDELLPENLDNFQRHDLTDEVFVLLEGKCILFFYDDLSKDKDIIAIDMEPNKLYNVKKGIYHTHTLSEDAKVLIVENRDTCDDNSPKMDVTEAMRESIVDQMNQLWL